MSAPEEKPSLEDGIARARAATREVAAALDEPPPWEPVWKRPRKPKPKDEKKRKLRSSAGGSRTPDATA